MATPGVLLRQNLPARAVLLLVHFLYSLVERLLQFFQRFQKRSRTESIRQEDDSCWENRLGRESASVEYGVRGLTKVPAHLVVMLGPEEPDYRQLARFICWGLAAGVGHVSFYDHRGEFGRQEFVGYLAGGGKVCGFFFAVYHVFEHQSITRCVNERRKGNVCCLIFKGLLVTN